MPGWIVHGMIEVYINLEAEPVLPVHLFKKYLTEYSRNKLLQLLACEDQINSARDVV